MMLEKELSCYKRCPPNQNILADEYLEDRKLMVAWCHRLCDGCNFKSELVQSVSDLLSTLTMTGRHVNAAPYTRAQAPKAKSISTHRLASSLSGHGTR